ncbi:DUF4144 family protein [Shewanella benthica]|uniref:Uncharacterized protein n=1 Tax=Shewanella benthica KT99 TaxID=314608 RepID=A9DCI2_9GAMM|nr:DUF4144 family protein [Shewanella benthica]EDQ00350.1 hypothetical protein KT99_09159 [Shewanella benthica KT99]
MKDTTQLTSTIHSKIHWPAILIHTGHDDLIYLANEQDWEIEAQGHIDAMSQLFDSSGITYRLKLEDIDNGKLNPHLNWLIATEPLELKQVLSSVRHHASTLGHCCTAKLGANTVKQVFDIMRYLEES